LAINPHVTNYPPGHPSSVNERHRLIVTQPEPPDKKAQFNYLVGLHIKWHGPFFYFCSRYCSPGPKALSPSFESRFARLQYAGYRRFNLAYFRHTGRWCEIAQLLSLEECLSLARVAKTISVPPAPQEVLIRRDARPTTIRIPDRKQMLDVGHP
jgi:hypothetical protein